MDNNLDNIYSLNNGDGNDNKKPEKPKVFKGAKVAIIIGIVVGIIGIFLLGILIGHVSYNGISKNQPIMDEVYGYLDKYYIDDVSREELDLKMAAGMAGVLDPYTGLTMLTPVTNGEYGISYSKDDYNVKRVTDVKEGSPLHGKLLRGDVVVGVKLDDDTEYRDVLHYDTVKFRDEVAASTTVTFKISRDGVIHELEKVEKMASIDEKLSSYMDTAVEGVGYIKLDSFDVNAADDFMESIYAFEKSGNNILIMDLRDNPGGTTLELSRITRNFIKNPTKKDVIINIKQRKQKDSITYGEEYGVNIGNELVYNSYIGDKIKTNTGKDFKMIVVANEMTASAAEAFIGNIKHYMNKSDYTIIGESERTFGKGIAQRDIRLKSDPTINLHVTIGKYYVLGEKGTSYESEYTNIHGEGYTFDISNIEKERKQDILSEPAILKAMEIASSWQK